MRMSIKYSKLSHASAMCFLGFLTSGDGESRWKAVIRIL